MDFKQIKNKNRYLYDSEGEFRIYHENTPVRHSWRHGVEGEWVFTDDGFVCEILRKFDVKEPNGKKSDCVRTVCGTFIIGRNKRDMLGEDGIAENIYTFSGKNIGQEEFNKRQRNPKELMFAKYVATGKVSNVEAYKLAFPKATSDTYIKNRCEKLLKTERIDKMITKKYGKS